MKRRTVLKRMGIASAGVAAATGNAAAKRSADRSVLADIDATIDVSDVAGEVVLADLLSDEQLTDLDGDPGRVTFHIDADLEEITPSTHNCCDLKCCDFDLDCWRFCECCICDNCNL